MNIRFLAIAPLIASSSIFIASCSSDSNAFEPPAGNNETPSNAGVISQKNFSILAEDTQPKVFDLANGTATDTTVIITVKIGDGKNQLLTDAHTVFFATEWGLIEPSCITDETGTCTVDWQTSFGVENGQSTVPDDHLTTIVAWSAGEENFTDTNADGIFAEPDSQFDDREEPFIDVDTLDSNFSFDPNVDIIIDVINGNDPTGANGVHDTGDTFMNSPNCQHTTLCSTVSNTVFVWSDIVLQMDGPPTP